MYFTARNPSFNVYAWLKFPFGLLLTWMNSTGSGKTAHACLKHCCLYMFSYFSKKIIFAISCRLSPLKCLNLFFWKKYKENILKYWLLKLLPRVLSIKCKLEFHSSYLHYNRRYYHSLLLQDNNFTPTGIHVALFDLPRAGPNCSKLTMSLVNDSLKFTSSDTQICWNFSLEKMWVAFAVKYQNIVYWIH